MIEIKIIFKNGEIVYYTSNENIEELFEVIGDGIRDGKRGIITLKEMANDKKTLVDIQDITTFGYSSIEDELISQEEKDLTTIDIRDKNWLDILVKDKGERYQVTVDNDSVWVEDKERDLQPVYYFQEFGYELALVLLQYMGIKAKMC